MKSLLDDVYSNSKKAYNSDELEDVQYYSKKARSAAEDALRSARRLKCPEAERLTKEAHNHAHSAYNSDELDDAQYYARNAMRAAENALSELQRCENMKKVQMNCFR
jgi:hypothetical protein